MHCNKLNDILIIRKIKDKDNLEWILKLDFSPLYEPGSGFSYRSRLLNQLNTFPVKTGSGTETVI